MWVGEEKIRFQRNGQTGPGSYLKGYCDRSGVLVCSHTQFSIKSH